MWLWSRKLTVIEARGNHSKPQTVSQWGVGVGAVFQRLSSLMHIKEITRGHIKCENALSKCLCPCAERWKNELFKCSLMLFKGFPQEKQTTFSSLRQWWGIGKSQIKNFCLQFKGIIASLQDTDTEAVELWSLVDSTGNQCHAKALKNTAWRTLQHGACWSTQTSWLPLRWIR